MSGWGSEDIGGKPPPPPPPWALWLAGAVLVGTFVYFMVRRFG